MLSSVGQRVKLPNFAMIILNYWKCSCVWSISVLQFSFKHISNFFP